MEQSERLKSESVLRERLEAATRAETLMQTRLDESLASESRLQKRLSIAQAAAQSQQTTLDQLVTSEAELRAQLSEQRSAQREGMHLSLGEVEQEWSTCCQVLRRSLHEVEAESSSNAADAALVRASQAAEHAATSGLAAVVDAREEAMRRAREAKEEAKAASSR